MTMQMTNNEHYLEVYKEKSAAYRTVIEFIDRMMPREPFRAASDKDKRNWESETRALRALKCDVYKELMSTDSMKDYYAKLVAEADTEENQGENEV